jgi:hypothetical protein
MGAERDDTPDFVKPIAGHPCRTEIGGWDVLGTSRHRSQIMPLLELKPLNQHTNTKEAEQLGQIHG